MGKKLKTEGWGLSLNSVTNHPGHPGPVPTFWASVPYLYRWRLEKQRGFHAMSHGAWHLVTVPAGLLQGLVKVLVAQSTPWTVALQAFLSMEFSK